MGDTAAGRTDHPWRWVVLPAAVFALVLLVPLTVFFVGVWLSGSQLQVVQTGSMEPTYPTGSLLVVRPVDPSEVEPGQALMFRAEWRSGAFVSHRVNSSEVTDDGLVFHTQGDANVDPDPFPVPARDVRGVVSWHVPVLGDLVWALRWPRNVILLVLVPLLILVVTEVRAARRRGRDDPDSDSDSTQAPGSVRGCGGGHPVGLRQ